MLTVYHQFELVFGTIVFAVLYTMAYNALHDTMDIANVLFTTAIFAISYWLSLAGTDFFVFNKTQSLDTPSANDTITSLV